MKIVLFILCFMFAAGCHKTSLPQEKKPTVLVSLAPYAYVVKKLAPQLVEVETLVPTGANPHLYEAPLKKVEQHKKAALWIYLGENFDKKMLQSFKENGSEIQTIDVAQGIELLEEEGSCSAHCHHDSKDLHLWMSPSIVKVQAEKIAQGLIKILPDHKQLIEENLTAFILELDLLDKTLADLLAPKKGSSILVSHPAFAYFCKEYGLHQLSIETEGKEPKPQDIDHLLFHAREGNIETIITEPQHSNKGAEAMAEALGISTQMIDPYTEDYTDNLLNLAKLIAK